MHQEKDFETIIEQELLNHYGYHPGNPENYDQETALFHAEIINFIQTTQPKQWDKFSRTSPGEAQKTLIASLTKELKSRGMLDVLRNGFKCYGKTFKVAYFQPNTGMNPDTIELYNKNRLTLTRQVKIKTNRIPDILLSLNGLPIATLELKNQLTGQTYRNAIHQYQTLEKKGTTVTLTTKNKRFAIIVDEAHSSQSGETAAELRGILNQDGIEAAIAHQLLDDEPDDDLSEAAQQKLLRTQLTRTKQPNLSYFAFTATPKQRTLLLFDEPGETGQAPFHLYTMRQAIEEGFIKDVLANYTCYARYYQLVRRSETDPNLPRRKAAKEIARFVELHPHNIAQKVEIIVEHFRDHTCHKIGGRAKAMVVTRSREQVVKYKLAFDHYLKEKGYTDIKSLVAFSGSVPLPEFPNETFTEVRMNGGIKSSEIPEKFASNDYQVLLVANKFQTGFDQPLLHTMFVDKRLAGVQAVQTISRLNRTAPGKEDTFVLDFVNPPEDIYKAFKPYYEQTPLGETADPQQLNDLAFQLYNWRLFSEEDVNQWCEIWFRSKTSLTGGEHQKLNTLLDPIIDQYKTLEAAERDQFKSQLTSFRNLYLFLAQIIPYQDSDLEKLYAYSRFLLKKLPRSANAPQVDLSGDIEMKFYRLQKISEGKINLNEGEADALKGAIAVGTRQPDKEVPLSQLIDSLNERFGTDFTPADQLFFEQITESAIANDHLKQAAQVNTKENFAPVLDQQLENLFIERMEGNEQIFMEVMNNQEFKQVVFEKLLESIYKQLAIHPTLNRRLEGGEPIAG
ncbi:type I restriction endonuclease [Coleofasciculus chthonoplastes]|uniref:type I restriction endonuclease n=1 Tax=Coleofasciculus chthonoplastes TaxID=64178 RepID=UPI0032FDF2F6